MARDRGNPNVMPRAAVVIVVLLFLVPGGIFFAKGVVEVADRLSGTTTSEATLTDHEVVERYSSRGSPQHRFLVRGHTADGTPFEFDDRRVYEIASGRTPLNVRVDVAALSGRIVGVRTGADEVARVGGATALPLAVLALGLGGFLATVPFLLPWRTQARKKARGNGTAVPPPDWGALAMVSAAALLVVGGTLAWDLLR